MPVRPLRPDDLPRVLALNNAAVPAVSHLDRAGLEHLVGQARLPWAACDGDGALVGFCLVLAPGADYGSENYRWFSERYSGFAYLDRVVIDPAHRSRGVGRALYAEVEAELATGDDVDAANWFCLEVNLRPRNDASLAFHDRLGFSEVGRQETSSGVLVSMQAKQLG